MRTMPAAATLLMPGCAVASAPAAAAAAAPDDARVVFERFVNLLYRRRQVRAAFESCVVAHGFRDHATQSAGSRSIAMSQLAPKLGPGSPRVELLHTVFDGDIGMVHLQVQADSQPPRPRVEIFRVADGRIVEHWSVAP